LLFCKELHANHTKLAYISLGVLSTLYVDIREAKSSVQSRMYTPFTHTRQYFGRIIYPRNLEWQQFYCPFSFDHSHFQTYSVKPCPQRRIRNLSVAEFGTVAVFGDTLSPMSPTVVENGDCRRRQIVAEFGDYSRQCGQGLSLQPICCSFLIVTHLTVFSLFRYLPIGCMLR